MNRLALKLFTIGAAALIQMSCSENETENPGQPQPVGEQERGVMDLQNGPSSRPLGESMH